MLRNARDLEGYTIHATDGDIGHVDDFYFDDEQWIVRYFVVETGTWLIDHRVLISSDSVGETLWNERKIFVELTREQVKNAPGVELHRPVTRQYEAALHDYYGWPYYWGAGLYGAGVYPGFLTTAETLEGAAVAKPAPEDSQVEDSHLQSIRDVTAFHIEAADGEIGHVEDFVIDEEGWSIRYLEVDTRNWWPGKKVLLAPSWIQHIDWQEAKVRVSLLRDIIQNAPGYDPSTPITREYEIRLFDYYGQHLDNHGNLRYWIEQGSTRMDTENHKMEEQR